MQNLQEETLFIQINKSFDLSDIEINTPILRDLFKYGKINVYDCVFSFDFEEVGIERCDQQTIKDLNKEYHRLIKKDPNSEEAKAIKQYIKLSTYRHKIIVDYPQKRRIRQKLDYMIYKELQQLAPELAKSIQKAIYYSEM